MLVEIQTFSGERPILDDHRLPGGTALRAVDTRLENGTLTPLSAHTPVTDLTEPARTIYRRASGFVSWNADVSVAPGPIAADRLYITGDGEPRIELPNGQTYPMALPAPEEAAAASTQGVVDPDLIETILFSYTFVTELGEESAPAPLSNAVQWSPGLAVRLTGFSDEPAGRGVTAMRIYRSQSGTTAATDLYYVAEIPVSAVSYDHDLEIDPLQNLIETTSYDPPPPGMSGLIAMPNGMMAAFEGRRLLFSEPYLPHAWPRAYELTVDYPIVGLVAFGSQLAVMTEGQPYRGQGTQPATFDLERLEQDLPCVSAAGIVDLGYAALYPSTDGLVFITSEQSTVISRQLFSRRQWAEIQPDTIRAAQTRGRYIFRCSGQLPGGGTTGIIDLAGPQPFLVRTSITPYGLYHDIRNGRLYFQEDGETELLTFDDVDQADVIPQTWESGRLDLPYPLAFSAIEAEGTENGPFALTIYAGNTAIHTVTALNRKVRLPQVISDDWRLRITGTSTVRGVKVATSMASLGGART